MVARTFFKEAAIFSSIEAEIFSWLIGAGIPRIGRSRRLCCVRSIARSRLDEFALRNGGEPGVAAICLSGRHLSIAPFHPAARSRPDRRDTRRYPWHSTAG